MDFVNDHPFQSGECPICVLVRGQQGKAFRRGHQQLRRVHALPLFLTLRGVTGAGFCADLVAQPHFFGVGAIEGLKGELTILDGKILATSAPTQAELTPIHVTDETQATLLIGDHVDQWTPIELDADYVGSAFEDQIKKLAQQQGLDTSKPFPFWIKGPILNMEFHVIRGACPVHAQKKGIELSDDEKPFHHHVDQVDGQLVGVFALGAAGKITHPGTSMHVHVVFTEDQQTNEITGHLERFGVAKGAVLYLPK